jgi:hypothetical protein
MMLRVAGFAASSASASLGAASALSASITAASAASPAEASMSVPLSSTIALSNRIAHSVGSPGGGAGRRIVPSSVQHAETYGHAMQAGFSVTMPELSHSPQYPVQQLGRTG